MFNKGCIASDMVKDHLDSKSGNLVPPLHGLFFLLVARVLLYALSHKQDSTYHGTLVGMIFKWNVIHDNKNLTIK